MSIPIRNSVKVLLFNDKNELLLMCADDPSTTAIDGRYNGRFWFLIGGKVESLESLQEAALREIYEETGITKSEIELGPIVWFGEFDMVCHGVLTHLKQKFIVAKTNQRNVAFTDLTPWENTYIKSMTWFSLEEIKNSNEIIYPVVLSQYLPDIILGKYPKKPFEIDLAIQPKKSQK